MAIACIAGATLMATVLVLPPGSGHGSGTATASAPSPATGARRSIDHSLASSPRAASPSPSASASSASSSPSPSATKHRKQAFPLPGSFRKARRWLARRDGYLGLAVVDSRGHLYGWHAGRMFISGSVTKAMLLVQYLRTHSTIDSSMRSVLTRMIELSDNDCADTVYAAVGGDQALNRVASLVHMRHFVATRGYWGFSYINAGDQARFFRAMERYIPKRHRAFARYILSHVVSWQSYGIPAVARPYWRVYFKGGWRTGLHGNRLLHQVARLKHGKTVFSVAILTDGSATDTYARETLRGVTRRLLGKTK